MTRLLLVRHAETDMAGRFCGWSDPPVNARGLQQIDALLASLASFASLHRAEGFSLDAVYSSGLLRAVTTAEALAAAYRCPFITRPDLREIGFGAWEGLAWDEIERRDPAYAQSWSLQFPELPAPGGETFQDFQARVLPGMECLLALPGEGLVAVVTHAGVLRLVLRAWCGIDEREAWARTSAYCSFFFYPPEVER